MRLISILEASHFSFLCDLYARSAQTSDEVLSVFTSLGSIRPSACAAEVTALSRMKPKRRSMLMWDF